MASNYSSDGPNRLQVWALQEGSDVVVGGKTNRAKLEFKEQLNKLFDLVPEVVSKGDPSLGS